MDLFKLLVFSLLVYGVTFQMIYKEGAFGVWTGVRKIAAHLGLGGMFGCFFCTGTWVSMAVSAIDYFLLSTVAFTPGNVLLGNDIFLSPIFLDMFVGSALAYLIHTVQDYVETTTHTVESPSPDVDNRILLLD